MHGGSENALLLIFYFTPNMLNCRTSGSYGSLNTRRCPRYESLTTQRSLTNLKVKDILTVISSPH